jgi:DNA-binding SARP family transcriptional activator
MKATGDRHLDTIVLFLRNEAAALLPDGRRVELERKEAGLLAYLALEGPSSRSRLAGLLWPDGAEERARGNLRQRLTRLRKSIGEAVVDDGNALRLATGVSIDTQSAGQLLSTLHYDDCPEFDQWLSRCRCSAQAQERERLLAEAQRMIDAGRFGEAVRLAEHAIACDPAAEEGYRRLMRWHYLRGDRAAAIAVWDRCKDVLRREYGLTPSVQTAQFGQAILGSLKPVTITVPPRAIPITVLRPPRLIGRRQPLQKMRAAWSQGQMFVVLGEGGIGKSRLLSEFARDNEAVLTSGARPGDAPVPYSTLTRLLSAANERFKPEVEPEVALDVGRLVQQMLDPGQQAPALSTDADRLRFLGSLESYAAACRAAGAYGVLIDDLQFADNASASVFRWLFDPERGSQRSWRAGFAARSETMGLEAHEFLQGLMASWQVAAIELEPLKTADIGTLVESLQVDELGTEAWAAALAQHAGGNPAYLLESIKTILAEGPVSDIPARLPVPATVEAAVERRLEQLTPEARTLAQLAAVAGAAFSVSLASSALDRPPLALTAAFSELERLQILKGCAFVHDIVQEATLRSVPEAIRQLLHRTVAEHLEACTGAPGVIAQHWHACADWGRAGRQWRVAADAATASSRPADAGDFLLKAQECFQRSGERAARFEALYEFALTSSHPDHGQRLPGVIDQMHELEADDEERLKTALVDAGFARGFSHSMRDVEHCERSARRALELAVKLGRDAFEFEARNILAFLLYYLDRGQEAVEVIEPNRNWAEAHGTPAQKVDLLDRYGIALWSAGRSHDALIFQQEAADLALSSGDYTRAVRTLTNLAENLGQMGRLGEASAVFADAIATRDRIGPVKAGSSFTELFLGHVDRELGHYCAALSNLTSALTEMQRSGISGAIVLAESELTLVWLALGQLAQAGLHSIAPTARPPSAIQAVRHLADLQLARARGHPREALVAAAAELARGAGHEVRIPIELEIARERAGAEAAGEFERLTRDAQRARLHGYELHARIELARTLLDIGQSDAAAGQARLALAQFEQIDPLGLYRPAVWWTAFRALEAAGETAAALDSLRAGRDWIEHTAQEHVPAEYRDSFLENNPLNRKLLTAARARLQ